DPWHPPSRRNYSRRRLRRLGKASAVVPAVLRASRRKSGRHTPGFPVRGTRRRSGHALQSPPAHSVWLRPRRPRRPAEPALNRFAASYDFITSCGEWARVVGAAEPHSAWRSEKGPFFPRFSGVGVSTLHTIYRISHRFPQFLLPLLPSVV